MDSTWKVLQKKNIDELIKAQNIELLKLNADKDMFMSILAHDLKSPFNALLGLSEVLATNLRSFEIDKIETLVGFINKSAKNTYSLLEDLLMWTRSQSGKMPFEPAKIRLSGILQDVIAEMKFSADNKQIEIILKAPEKTIVFADLEMVKTVIRNLVSNAIKFTKSGGKVTISAKRTKNQVCIIVSDNGIGIQPEVLNKLFDISQITTTRGTSNEGGTGLGLLLCKDFVEKHNGKIWVESEMGKGSTFSFSLPDR
jgi:signal transduction histidine kinase